MRIVLGLALLVACADGTGTGQVSSRLEATDGPLWVPPDPIPSTSHDCGAGWTADGGNDGLMQSYATSFDSEADALAKCEDNSNWESMAHRCRWSCTTAQNASSHRYCNLWMDLEAYSVIRPCVCEQTWWPTGGAVVPIWLCVRYGKLDAGSSMSCSDCPPARR